MSKGRAYASEVYSIGKYLALPANIRLRLRKLTQTYTLTYYTISNFLANLIFFSNACQPTLVQLALPTNNKQGH